MIYLYSDILNRVGGIATYRHAEKTLFHVVLVQK